MRKLDIIGMLFIGAFVHKRWFIEHFDLRHRVICITLLLWYQKLMWTLYYRFTRIDIPFSVLSSPIPTIPFILYYLPPPPILTFSGHAPINTLSHCAINSHLLISCDACFSFNFYRRFLFFSLSFVVFRMLMILLFIFPLPYLCTTYYVCQHVSK